MSVSQFKINLFLCWLFMLSGGLMGGGVGSMQKPKTPLISKQERKQSWRGERKEHGGLVESISDVTMSLSKHPPRVHTVGYKQTEVISV